MANSKYEYVRLFEKDDSLLPNTYIVVRIDGRGFHRYRNNNSIKKKLYNNSNYNTINILIDFHNSMILTNLMIVELLI